MMMCHPPIFNKLWVMLVAGLLLASSSLAGELYKWTDDKGIVHYSETKPEQQNDNLKSVDIGMSSGFKAVATAIPEKLSGTKSARFLALLKHSEGRRLTLPEANKKVVSYYFGGDCVSPSSKNMMEVEQNHRLLLPSEAETSAGVTLALHKTGYEYAITRQKPLINELKRHQDLIVLDYQLADLEYHVCKQRISSSYNPSNKFKMGLNPFDYQANDFQRRQLTISLRWTLTDGASGKTLYTTTTSGSVDHWHKDTYKARININRQAGINATYNLLTDPKVIAILQSPVVTKPAEAKEPGILDSIANFFSSDISARAQFAQVMSWATSFKAPLHEYRQSTGEWPVSLAAMGISESQAMLPDYVVKTEIDYDGSLIFYLSESQFPAHSILMISPELNQSAMQMTWQCSTSLDDDYHNGKCLPLP